MRKAWYVEVRGHIVYEGTKAECVIFARIKRERLRARGNANIAKTVKVVSD